MSKTRTLNLELRGAEGTIQETLNKIKGIENVSVQGNRYSAQLSPDASSRDLSPVVVKALVDAQIEVVQIREQSSTLEDVFIDAISQESEVADG